MATAVIFASDSISLWPWVQANINCQGFLDADLGDILSGIEALQSVEGLKFGHRVGIWGGSYGMSPNGAFSYEKF